MSKVTLTIVVLLVLTLCHACFSFPISSENGLTSTVEHSTNAATTQNTSTVITTSPGYSATQENGETTTVEHSTSVDTAQSTSAVITPSHGMDSTQENGETSTVEHSTSVDAAQSTSPVITTSRGMDPTQENGETTTVEHSTSVDTAQSTSAVITTSHGMDSTQEAVNAEKHEQEKSNTEDEGNSGLEIGLSVGGVSIVLVIGITGYCCKSHHFYTFCCGRHYDRNNADTSHTELSDFPSNQSNWVMNSDPPRSNPVVVLIDDTDRGAPPGSALMRREEAGPMQLRNFNSAHVSSFVGGAVRGVREGGCEPKSVMFDVPRGQMKINM